MTALLTSAEDELREQIRNRTANDDSIGELADSYTPFYYAEILAYAQDDVSLATEECEIGPAFDGSNTAVNIIAANIYARIYQHLSQIFNEEVHG